MKTLYNVDVLQTDGLFPCVTEARFFSSLAIPTRNCGMRCLIKAPALTSQILAVTSLLLFKKSDITLRGYVYPEWAHVTGFALVLLGLSFIPVFAVIELRKSGWARILFLPLFFKKFLPFLFIISLHSEFRSC